MGTISGGELVLRTLLKADVELAFGLHGAHIDTIFQAALDHSFPIIDTRNEAAAGHAAEGYARVSKKLGVALVTAGGGLTNVVTPLANALLDRTPILVITGSGPLREDETNTLQAGIDQVAVAKPVTKWAHRVTIADNIPRLLMQAIRVAQTAPRGPVLLDIPWDVLMQQVEEDIVHIPEPHLPQGTYGPDAATLDQILSALERAERPVLVVGSEAQRGRAAEDLNTLCQELGIPVFADYEGLSLLSDLGACNGGLLQGLHTFQSAGMAPDAVLMLGVRFGLNTGHGSGVLIPQNAYIIQIDPSGAELGRLQKVDLPIICDVAGAIRALAARASQRQAPDRAAWRSQVGGKIAERLQMVTTQAGARDAVPLHPLHASATLAKVVGPEIVLVADGALTYLWLSETVSRACPGGHLCHGYLGSMGIGMGIAVGAQVAARAQGKRAILVTGDGSVGYALGELDTLARHGLGLIVVVMNNRSWGATQHFQKMAVGANRVTNTMLENGAYEAAAEAFCVDGYLVRTADEFEAALESALAQDRPALINVLVDLDPIPPEEITLMGGNPFG